MQTYIPMEDAVFPTQTDLAQAHAESDFLWDAVMSLGEPDNEIFVRYYKYNETLKEIANAMGLNLSTIKTKLFRGKRKLKQLLQDAEESL